MLALSLTLACLLSTISILLVNRKSIFLDLTNCIHLQAINVSNSNYINGLSNQQIEDISKYEYRYFRYFANSKSKNVDPISYSDPSVIYGYSYYVKFDNQITSDSERTSYLNYAINFNKDIFDTFDYQLITNDNSLDDDEVYISYKTAIDLHLVNQDISKQENYNILLESISKSEIQFYIDDAKYKVAGIIDTNYKKLLDSFLNSPVSDPSILRVEQNCEIEQGFWVNDSLYQKIKDNTTSDSFEGMFLKVDTKTIDNVLEYIKDNGLDLYFRMYTSYFTANNFYTLIKYLTFVISIILLIISSLIYFNYASYIVDVNQKTIDCLYSIGISKLDLSKIFLLNNLFMPLVTGIISLCAYYGLLYGVNFVHSREDILILNIWYAKVNYIVFLISLIVLIAVLLLIFERKLIRRADSKKVRR